MDRTKEIVNKIGSISGRYSSREVFQDWVRIMAMSISNSVQLVHNKVWEDRERVYVETIKKYDTKEVTVILECFNMLLETLEYNKRDVLGEIYMSTNQGNKATGQFFTPFNISLMTASLILDSIAPDEKGFLRINEPSCGGGGMIIACASVLENKNVNYQKVLKVVCQDLDYISVFMTYVQLSLLGIQAIVVQGDTLIEPFDNKTEASHIFYTPAERGLLI